MLVVSVLVVAMLSSGCMHHMIASMFSKDYRDATKIIAASTEAEVLEHVK